MQSVPRAPSDFSQSADASPRCAATVRCFHLIGFAVYELVPKLFAPSGALTHPQDA
jgi:hypothetical protein